MKTIDIKYPTIEHESVATAVINHFKNSEFIKAVLLTNSCARNRATKDSCLDMMIVLAPGLDTGRKSEIKDKWLEYKSNNPVFSDLTKVGLFSEIDLEFSDAIFDPSTYYHGWTTGPDNFELEIGNTFKYSIVLWDDDSYFHNRKKSWLPYYDEELQKSRLINVIGFFNNNLNHVQPYAERELYFACMKRIQNAFGEFLQALFISRKIYPIAYDKHIKEQITEILGEKELYEKLKSIFEIPELNERSILEKKDLLRGLMKEYVIKDLNILSESSNSKAVNENKKNISCLYDNEMGGIIANIAGNISLIDIDEFIYNLQTVIHEKTIGKKFTLLLNGNGYYPESVEVHKKYSALIKTNELLKKYCRAVAHVHHDPDHIREMKSEQSNFQGFFTEFNEAYLWLRERKNI